MSDIRLAHLRAYSPSAADEGEEYWTLNLVDLIDIMAAEIADSPQARGMNPATGEIIEGPFFVLLGHLADWLRAGYEFRIAPKDAP